MNYNHFTINYIKAIKKNLKISLNSKNEPIFFPDKIKAKNIESLKNDLNNLWLSSESALSIVKAKHDSTIQSCLFGLVNNLDTALKAICIPLNLNFTIFSENKVSIEI